MKKNVFFSLLILLIAGLVFHNWFTPFPLSSGDWDYQFLDPTKSAFFPPNIWDYRITNGFGANGAYILGPNYYFTITAAVLARYMDWSIIERLVWFWPFLAVITGAAYYFSTRILKHIKFFPFTLGIFLLNSYILLLTSGGQMGIAFAYAIAPFVFTLFMQRVNSAVFESVKKISVIRGLLITAVALSLQLMFDIRITYITLLAVVFYTLFQFFRFWSKTGVVLILRLLFIFFVSGTIASLLQSFWLLPFAILRENPLDQLGAAYNSLASVTFFSFAKFEDALGLLHPNWPENIFGKTYFMRAEFLLLPLLAFSSLLFINNKKSDSETTNEKNTISFFVLLGLLGVFLAKGANEPFGFIYLWMFDHLPGFMMFRDPTKFYLLIVLAYAVLIPFSVWKIYDFLKTKEKTGILPSIFLTLVLLFLVFLIRPVFFGQVGGTFRANTISESYRELETFLAHEPKFFRTLWIPTRQRFSYYSINHPRVMGQDYFKTYDNDKLLKKLADPKTEVLLQEAAIKYVFVPDDYQREIFLTDRKFDEKLYLKTVQQVDRIPWLKKLDNFGKIAVYEVSEVKDHFWGPAKELVISYTMRDPTSYEVTVKNAKKDDLVVFSEHFDSHWEATVQTTNQKIQSRVYRNGLNSFVLPADGDYTLQIYYTPQKLVDLGGKIGIVTLLVVAGGFVFISLKERKKR